VFAYHEALGSNPAPQKNKTRKNEEKVNVGSSAAITQNSRAKSMLRLKCSLRNIPHILT
jgi:hypothetical protein